MAIGNALRRARESRGITLEIAADVIDSDAGNLSRKERGKQPWTDREIQALADHYGVRVSALYLEEEEQKPEGGQRKSRRKATWDALFYTLEHRGVLDDAFRLLSTRSRPKRAQ